MILEPQIYRFDDFVVHVPGGRIYYRDVVVPKRGKVIDLLALLIQTREQPLKNQILIDCLWGKDHGVNRRHLDVLFGNLRKLFDSLGVHLGEYVQRDGLARFTAKVECLPKYPDVQIEKTPRNDSVLSEIKRGGPQGIHAERVDHLLQKIRLTIDSNQFQNALALARDLPLSRLSRKDLRCVCSWFAKAESLPAGDAAIALSCYDVAIKTGLALYRFSEPSFLEAAESARVMMLKAILLARLGRRTSALAIYREVRERFSRAEYGDLRYYCATALLKSILSLNRSGKLIEARTHCDLLIKEYGDSGEVTIREITVRGMRAVAFICSPLEDALALYGQIKTRYGGDKDFAVRYQVIDALCDKTLRLSKAQRFGDALSDAEEIINSLKSDDDSSIKLLSIRALRCKAVCLSKLDRLEESLQTCDHLLALTSGRPDLARETARSLEGKVIRLFHLDRHAEAITVCDSFIEIFGQTSDPQIRDRLASVLKQRARLCALRSRDDDAIESYDLILQNFSESEGPQICISIAEAIVRKRSILLDRGQLEKASRLFEELRIRFESSSDPKIRDIIRRVTTQKLLSG